MSGPGTPDDVVELRVHGISGASAGQVLDVQQIAQVAGDRSGGSTGPAPGTRTAATSRA
ncbi:hypothetical protein GCM10027614_71550 [Micromonospora vulcania]